MLIDGALRQPVAHAVRCSKYIGRTAGTRRGSLRGAAPLAAPAGSVLA